MRKMKLIFAVIAIILIIMGFGMIHGKSVLREQIGNISIGVGSLYLIFLLYLSWSKDKKKLDD